MQNIHKDGSMDYAGKNYHKSVSGLWLEASYKTENDASSGEETIKNFAKNLAKRIRKPTSTIKIPFEKEIQYEVEKDVEVTEGFFIFKSTRTEKIKEKRAGTNIDYKDVRIDGWIFKTYYENVDTVVDRRRIEQEIARWFYVLMRDGSLSVFHLGYSITHPKTNWEKVKIWRELIKTPMTFDPDKVGLGSAYCLDFKPIKWEFAHKRCAGEILYFKRNYPERIGRNESAGESYLIREAGTGILEALKKLEGGRVNK